MPETEQLAKPIIGRFIDPFTDFAFKRLFGAEPNKDLLISFLNSLFRGRKVIKNLYYSKNEYAGPTRGHRKSIFDLNCVGADGESFIIEMQRASQDYFRDRGVYYTSTLIHERGPRGDENWEFQLGEIYFIGIMDFRFSTTAAGQPAHWVWLTEEGTDKPFYDKLCYTFLEIPNFNKGEDELETDLDKWLFVLKNLHRLDKIPLILNKRIFQKLFKIAEVSNLKKEEFMQYEKSLMDKWNENAIVKTAENRGVGKGKEEKSIEVVNNLLASNKFTTAEIANFASVSEAFVQKVRASLEKKK